MVGPSIAVLVFLLGGVIPLSKADDPPGDTWTPITTIDAPSPRFRPGAAWTGDLLLIWGGENSPDHPETGGRYDPASDTWTPISTVNAPEGRQEPATVWTGSLMIVWGGARVVPEYVNTGGRYNPVTDTWTPTSTLDAPAPRSSHSWVWTGTEMIVNGPSGVVELQERARVEEGGEKNSV